MTQTVAVPAAVAVPAGAVVAVAAASVAATVAAAGSWTAGAMRVVLPAALVGLLLGALALRAERRLAPQAA